MNAPEPVGEAHEHDWSWWYVNANPEIAERFRYCRSCNLREDAQSVGEADPRQEGDGSLVCCDERRAAEAERDRLRAGIVNLAATYEEMHQNTIATRLRYVLADGEPQTQAGRIASLGSSGYLKVGADGEGKPE